MQPNSDLRFNYRAALETLTQVNWQVSFYCTNEVCYTKY